jgi:arabinofuranosyltransferase
VQAAEHTSYLNPGRWLVWALVVLFAVVVVRTAWLSEDAYFTFRSVENWVHGYGARWNISERVQVYTHPLWFGLLSLFYLCVRNMAAIAFALSFICTAATIYVLVRRLGASWQSAALALGCLITSKSFIDYSTSGLENPLSHVLLLGFFAGFWADEHPDPKIAERRLAGTCLFGGLLICNRMDLGLLLGPALLYAIWPPRASLRRVGAIALGFSPFVVWEIISLIYYGFLVPNTAYAKLGADVPTPMLLLQGYRYFANSLKWDPLTLTCIGLVSVISLARLRKRPKQACAALGILLYLGYVLSIGGDYMSGRFFSAPLVVAAGLIANWGTIRRWVFVVGAAAIVGLAYQSPNPTVLSGKDYADHNLENEFHIDDERGYRFKHAGLISERKTEFLEYDGWYRRGVYDRKRAERAHKILVGVKANVGYMGFAAGPWVHYVNPYGITDPLLARLPGYFRGPGHLYRPAPNGYILALMGKGEIVDPNLAAYWADLALIIRAPIWSKRRWAAIWRMHSGANQHLLDAYVAAHPR